MFRKSKIEITGWEIGFRTVAAIQLLKHQLNIGLKEAHDLVERVVEGEKVTIRVPFGRDRSTLSSALEELGAKVRNI